MRSCQCPTRKCLPQRKELRLQLERRRQAFWAVSGEGSTARQCRGYGAVPESYSCWRYEYRLKAAAASLPSGKQSSAAQFFHAAVEMAPVSMKGFHSIMPVTQGLPQRNESFECSQTDGSRQYGPCPVRGVQPDRGALEHEHEVVRQSVRGVSKILNNMHPSDVF